MENRIGILTLLLGVVSAVISIAAFLLPDATKNRGLRIAIGVSFLFLTMILGGAGGMMLIAPIDNPLDTGAPSDTHAPAITKPSVTSANTQITLLGLWEYGKARNPMPTPAVLGQVILANGDIDDSGTCHIKIFGPGEIVEGLGNGTFQLWLITGTPEQIMLEVQRTQNGAAAHARGECPELP